MNIQQAKEQIQNTIKAYFSKDETGEYIYPIERQRPIFLMGPPGIGKTAIMEQISAEAGVGLLSYPMTHHTRNSVLGLPFIDKKIYNGMEVSVTEYTMSEIIASMYDFIAETGVKEGILFLDEINCVEESLQPVMLQFLQNKVFGRHRIPDGWIVVTAGNPPEYNESGRDFDIVTWDRLKRIDVTPDFEPWRNYAYGKGLNQAVVSYIECNVLDFYRVETLATGKFTFVSARAWEDLSQMIELNEKNGIATDHNLISQYLQNPRVSKNFSSYYKLYTSCKETFPVQDILFGRCTRRAFLRAKEAKEDEKAAICGLIYAEINKQSVDCINLHRSIEIVEKIKKSYIKKDSEKNISLERIIDEETKIVNQHKKAQDVTREDIFVYKLAINYLRKYLQDELSVKEVFDDILIRKNKEKNKKVHRLHKEYHFAFSFFERTLTEDILEDFVHKLEISPFTREFIETFGCNDYFEFYEEEGE